MWATDLTTADLTWPTPQFSENFNSLSTSSSSSVIKTNNTELTAYGIFNKMYNNNTSNTYAIASNNTFGSNVLSLSSGSSSPVIASITSTTNNSITFATKGAFSFKVLKTSKCDIGLYAVDDNTAYTKANTSVYFRFTDGTLTIGNGSGTWVTIGDYTTNTVEVCVVYNNTTTATTYGNNISLASKTAHVFVNGTCVMDNNSPKAFTIPGADLTVFRVLPQTANGNTAIIDDVKIYDALPTGSSGPTISTNPSVLSSFTYVKGEGPSAAQTVSVSGSNLSANISLSLGESSNYEMSTSENSGYTNSLTLTQTSGSVAATTVYVRLKASLEVGSYNGTITLSSTGADNKTVNLTGSVTPPPTLTYDFTSNTSWGLPNGSNNKATSSASFTMDGKTVTLAGGYYFDNAASAMNLVLGKQNATMTFPAFPFKVKKIIVYGTDGASASVTFNIFLNDVAVSTSATSSKVTHTFDIAADKQATGNVYVLKVTNDNNMRITKVEIFADPNATITTHGWATWYFPKAVSFPNTINAYVVALADEETAILDPVTSVPANTPVLLQGASGTYTMTEVASANAPTYNCLSVSTGVTVNNIYVLAKPNNEGDTTYPVGFYKWNGGILTPGKIYMQLTGDETRSFVALPGEGSGINNVNLETTTDNRYFDLQGRPVAQPTKGLYIVNGKKVIIK